MSKLNGRPKGAKAKAPAVPILAAKRALEGIKERAAEGSAEDQRILYLGYVVTNSPLSALLSGAGLESSA